MGGNRFGYIAFGSDELFARGAIFSALRLLHHCPDARILVLTDNPAIFAGYPIETIELTAEKKAETSFGNRYKFGIKAAGIIDLLRRCERLFFMDADMYPTGDISGCFQRISASSSLMWRCEGRPKPPYRALGGKGLSLGDDILTGDEPMWASGVVGVHHDNIPALERAYAATGKVREIVRLHTPEQFCTGIALSQDGRTISRHGLPIGNYNTRGKKLHARRRIDAFFELNGKLSIEQQMKRAATYRVWRAPLDLLLQRDIWHF